METIAAACARVLNTAAPGAKLMNARAVARDWRLNRLAHRFDGRMPDRPARPATPRLVAAARMPKRGRAGSLRARVAMLHALAHIELNAIDLAFDTVGRFGAAFPPAFADDWLRVGAEEAIHFALVARRLRAIGSHYGALPAHDSLWDSAQETSGDALARFAVVPMVLEARGLDVSPAMIDRFAAAGDGRSAAIMRRILADEEGHVAVGVRWFGWATGLLGDALRSRWQDLVQAHFTGSIRPPFNDSARERAGLTRDFYEPLAVPR